MFFLLTETILLRVLYCRTISSVRFLLGGHTPLTQGKIYCRTISSVRFILGATPLSRTEKAELGRRESFRVPDAKAI